MSAKENEKANEQLELYQKTRSTVQGHRQVISKTIQEPFSISIGVGNQMKQEKYYHDYENGGNKFLDEGTRNSTAIKVNVKNL